MGARQLLRPHFCSMLAAVVQRSAAARGAAKGAVQWEFVVREMLSQKVCRIPHGGLLRSL